MTNQQHPTTPPPELIKQLEDDWFRCRKKANVLLIQAYQAGADQELEACCEWLVCNYNYPEDGNPLRAARRPKPPSLKEQALALLEPQGSPARLFNEDQMGIIRRALEQLDD
jgi:hypothetical protein